MKQWRCMVCGEIYGGKTPPPSCPLCGADQEEFTWNDEGKPATLKILKRWKCIVCHYIHSGETPPKACPLCGGGKELFVLINESNNAADPAAKSVAVADSACSALEKMNYGLYIITSVKDNKLNGQCSNTAFQLTDKPARIAVCINKNNLTHEYIMYSKTFAVTVLGQNQLDAVYHFGFSSGRTTDKFKGIKYYKGQTGCPIIPDCIAYIEAVVLPDKMIDVGTHTLFVADIVAGRKISGETPLTYARYREQKGSKDEFHV